MYKYASVCIAARPSVCHLDSVPASRGRPSHELRLCGNGFITQPSWFLDFKLTESVRGK